MDAAKKFVGHPSGMPPTGVAGARALLAEGRDAEAERVARQAVLELEDGGEPELLAEALTTHGVALARTGEPQLALKTLRRAVETAEGAGDRVGAGCAALAIIEELHEHVPPRELGELFELAFETLCDTQNSDTLNRLNACARSLVQAFAATDGDAPNQSHDGDEHDVDDGWENFSLKQEVRRYEAKLIVRALRDAGGVVSHAAKLLGFKHHQTFIALLNSRHKELLDARTPIVPRKRKDLRPRRAEPRKTPL
jgi:tetratricopeptide (TPR) repeat protein